MDACQKLIHQSIWQNWSAVCSIDNLGRDVSFYNPSYIIRYSISLISCLIENCQSFIILFFLYYVIRAKNEVLCAEADSLAPERNDTLFFLQTFTTNYLRNVKKPGRRLYRLIH
jgi:hypothetical protein